MDKYLWIGCNKPKIGRMIFMKAWWESRTIWSAIVVLLATIAGAFGFVVDEGTQGEIVDLITAVVAGIAGLAAIVYRIKATKQIK